MMIVLNKQLICDYICKTINNYLTKELKDAKNISNYALTFTLTEIKDSEIIQTKNISKK